MGDFYRIVLAENNGFVPRHALKDADDFMIAPEPGTAALPYMAASGEGS